MKDNNDDLGLQAMLPAAELARLRRRIAFLEAAVLQVLRSEGQLREFFTARELAELALPGLPKTASGIARQARREHWERRITAGRGGEQVLFHFSALPRHAFAAFVDRVVKAGLCMPGEVEAVQAEAFPAVAAPPLAAASLAVASSATPIWLLPLLRLLRSGSGDLEDAVRSLPSHVTRGASCPTADEARDVLRGLGMMVG